MPNETPAPETLIELNGASKSYGTGPGAVTALDNISLSISPGEFVAIMGPSGSGKSSLMNLLGLLDIPTAGTLRLAGQDVTSMSPDAQSRLRNAQVGFVFQSYCLMPRRTALGNVELPLAYRGVRRTERRRRALAALETVGLAHRTNHIPATMSGGEQQRVSVARALVTEPALIVADEPTGALDSKTGQQILVLLKSIHAADRTIVMVTHDAAAAAYASRRLEIRDGRILSDSQGASVTEPVRPAVRFLEAS